MNLSNGQPHPFEIPELCNLIASHLDRHDFTQLCLVSRNFSQLFRPFLWSEVVLESFEEQRSPYLPWTQGLKQNGHLVKHVELVSWISCDESYDGDENENEDPREADRENNDVFLTETLLASCGANVTSLKIVDHSCDGRIWSAFLKRIYNNRTLEGAQQLNMIRTLDINLANDILNNELRPLLARPENYPEALAVFAGVEELRLEMTVSEHGYCYSSGSGPRWKRAKVLDEDVEPLKITFWGLAKLFPRMHKLTLSNIVIVKSEDDAKIRPFQLETCHPEYPQLHTLDFRECGISAKQIVQILERSPRVRSLSIGSSPLLGNAEILVDSIRALVPHLRDYEQHGFVLAGLSTMLRGLRHLTGVCFASMRVQDDELRTLAESCPLLERLSLFNCKSLSYRGLKLIVGSFTRLMSLRLQATAVSWDIFGQDPAQSTAHDTPRATEPMPSSPVACCPWVCQDTLQDLALFLTRPDNNSQLVDLARQRLQSFPKLRSLKLNCKYLPASMLLDPRHKDDRSNDRPAILYPALKTLDVLFISPTVRLRDTMRMVRSMPKLTKGITTDTSIMRL